MSRRIAAGLLAMILLVSVLPAGAQAVSPLNYEEEFYSYEVYQPGKKYAEGSMVWVQGNTNKADPDDIIKENENGDYSWEPVRNSSGSIKSLPSCLKVEHPVCNNSEGTDCLLNEEGKCIREQYTCRTSHKRTNAYYLYVANDSSNDFGGGGGTGPAPSIPGSAALTVYNIDDAENPNPIHKSEFILLAPPRGDSANKTVKGRAETNNGYAYFTDIVLDEGIDEEVWELNQQAFPTGSSLQNKYAPYQYYWNVTIVREKNDPETPADDTFSVKSVEPVLKYETETEADPGYYDETTKTITVINKTLLCNMDISMDFVGITKSKLPKDKEFGIDVVITRENDRNFKETVEFPIPKCEEEHEHTDNCYRSVLWKTKVTDLVADTYYLEIVDEYATVPGYEKGDSIPMLSWPAGSSAAEAAGGNPVVSWEVTVGYNRTQPIFTILNNYESLNPDEDTSGGMNIKNKIIVKTEANGEPLPGAAYGVYRSADSDLSSYIKLFEDEDNDGEITIEGLEEYRNSTLVLKQYSTAEDYDCSEDCYYITITPNDNDESEVRIGETPEQLGGKNIVYDYAGNQIVTIKNVLKPEPSQKISISLTCQVEVDMSQARNHEDQIEHLKNTPHPFYVVWDGGQSEILNLKDGQTDIFDLDIPATVPYKVVAAGENNPYETVISNRNGPIDSRLVGDAVLTATNHYKIISGTDPSALLLTKVDSADSAKTLEGATFELKDGENNVVGQPYETKQDGAIDIADVLEPGEYTLKETKAPEGYILPKDPIQITVTYDYVPDADGAKVIWQEQMIQVAHKDIVQDEDGRYFIKNLKKDPATTTTVRLSLEDIEINWNGCAEDGKQRSEFATREYEFVLSLLDDKGNWQDEPNTLKLRAGEATKTGIFSTALPVGTTYKVRAAGSENLFNVEISGDDQSGTEYVGTVERAESINLTTKLKYELKQGTYETPALHLVKVDAGDISKTLPGAVFVLKNAAGNTIGQPYTTTQTGAMDIVGVLKELGKYTLTETKAPDGYTQLSAPIDVEVKYQYTLDETDGEKAVRQDLVASAFHEKAVSLGSDGKYYIKNTKTQNPSKETAQVRLTLDDIQVNWNGCEEDSAMRSEAADMEYEFVLSWRDEKGVWKTDPNRLKLYSGNTTKTGTFRKEIPVGAAYRVSAAGSDNLFDVVFANTAGGGEKNSVYEGTAEKAGIIDLTAKVKYELQRGEYSPDLYMIKVAARDTSKTLAGAKFSLKDEDAEVLETFQTKKDGRIEIIDLFDDYPSTYTLKEVKAPDEYIKLDTVIHITVDYAYTPETVNGKTVIVQDLVASASHPDVKLGADGWYYIKNTHMSDNPKTGDNFSVVLWSSMLAVSAAGLTALLAGSKRRRKVR